MENLVDKNLFGGIYNNKRVLVTGHTGFKGSWLSFWLNKMGAEVAGLSLAPNTKPSHFEILDCEYKSYEVDIRDQKKVTKVFEDFCPEIVFHMAAQPLVRLAYELIDETFETNVLGSLRVYEACRHSESVKSIISITTDKVYENLEQDRPFVESDPLGGKDPYSASKAAMEILSSSYRHSFLDKEKKMTVVRAGNVIGGGDWSKDRLIPDLVLAANEKRVVEIRSPNAVRPWQHVLDCLSGYLLVGQLNFNRSPILSNAYNFGPSVDERITVKEVIEIFNKYIGVDYKIETADLYESTILRLDCSKATNDFSWQPLWDANVALEKTALWYSRFYEHGEVSTNKDLLDYINAAEAKNLVWTK